MIKIRKGLLFFFLAKTRILSAAAEERVLLFSRKEGESRRSRPLCDFATLRLCVNKKKNVSQRREDAKKYNRSLALACLTCRQASLLLPACRQTGFLSLASQLSSFASFFFLIYISPLNGKMDFSLEQFENPIN